MRVFRNYILLCILLGLVTGCKQNKKKPSLSGEDPVAVEDLIDFFQPLHLPFQIGDTILDKKEKDSLLIGYKVMTQFIPDSVFHKIFGKGSIPKCYPVGRINVSKTADYLLVKAVTAKKKNLLVFCFNPAHEFVAEMVAIDPDKLSITTQSLLVDRKLAFIKTIVRRNKDGTISDGRDVYALDMLQKKFGLVMTDPLDDKLTEIINPIDTLTKKNKYAADYGTGKLNLVSIRDGRKAGRISFYIHLEKNNGSCIAALKGEAVFSKPTIATYRENGEPCMLEFIFSNSSVRLKEIDGCGSRRGLDCLFDGVYNKKKTAKPPAAKK